MNYLSRHILLLGAVSALAAPVAARVWDNTTTDGTVTVGPGGDYTTLSACATAFNATAGGINANWVISVLAAGSPYSEPSCNFANQIAAGKTVTLKPASSATVQINFSEAATQTINGGLIIGASNVSSGDSVVTTTGFLIDGSNNGSKSRDLTLTYGGSVAGHVINVWGASSNGVIKNVNITNAYAGTTQVDGIRLNARQATNASAAAGPNEPNNWTIQDCVVTATSGTQTDGIGCSVNGTLSTGYVIQGFTIKNTTVTATYRAIRLNHNANTTIDGNTLRIAGGSPNNISKAIYHDSTSPGGVNGVGGWTMTISNNKIDQLEYTQTPLADVGIRAMDLSNSPTATPGSYVVYNNMISGFNFTGVTANPPGMNYIGIISGANGGTHYFNHNSFNMPNFTDIGTTTAGTQVNRIGGIIVTQGGATMVAKNNIIRMFQDNGIGILKGSSPTITADGNDIFVNAAGTNQRIGRVNAIEYPTFANWQTAGYDANGHNVDPVSTSGSHWASDTASDLHFVPGNLPPLFMNGVTGVTPAVTLDIDGQARQVPPIAGADEVINNGSSAAQDWSMFQ
jgi:hypothetical protein